MNLVEINANRRLPQTDLARTRLADMDVLVLQDIRATELVNLNDFHQRPDSFMLLSSYQE
jgi:hypothetical protein